MGCSAPALRVGTLTLAVGAACGFSLHAVGVTKHRFSRSERKPGRASRDDGSRWRGPEVTHGCHAERKNGSPASELRCRCAWLHHGSGPWTHRIQGCGAIDTRPKAGSPLIVIPTAPSVPSCSKLSRYGLARAKHVERLVRRPTLTAPARDGLALLWVGMKKRAFRSNKETDEGQKHALHC